MNVAVRPALAIVNLGLTTRGSSTYSATGHILLALLELEAGPGVLAGLGLDQTAAEASITAAVATESARQP